MRAFGWRPGFKVQHTPGCQSASLGIRNLDPESEYDASAERTLELVEATRFAGSGLDLPDFLSGPRGVGRNEMASNVRNTPLVGDTARSQRGERLVGDGV